MRKTTITPSSKKSAKKEPAKPQPIDLSNSCDLERVWEMYPEMMKKLGEKNVKFFYAANICVATYYNKKTNSYTAGFAFCKEGENFCKKMGRAIALYRVVTGDPALSTTVKYCGNGFITMCYCWWLCNRNFPEDWRGCDFPRI